MTKPFVVVVKFHSGQTMYFEEHTRTRAINIAMNYRDYTTVQSATVYRQMSIDSK